MIYENFCSSEFKPFNYEEESLIGWIPKNCSPSYFYCHMHPIPNPVRYCKTS